jgi:AcrR family transcriptional regulator
VGRRDEYAEATRRAIIEAALELFVERGFHKTSMEEIGEYARVTKGAIYYHFAGGKESVFEAVLAEVIGERIPRLREKAVSSDDSWQAITAVLGCYLDVCIERVFFRLVLQECPIALGWEHARRIEGEFLLGNFLELAERCVGDGILVDVTAGMLLRTLVGAVHELAFNVNGSSDRERAAVQAKALINELVASVRKPP